MDGRVRVIKSSNNYIFRTIYVPEVQRDGKSQLWQNNYHKLETRMCGGMLLLSNIMCFIAKNSLVQLSQTRNTSDNIIFPIQLITIMSKLILYPLSKIYDLIYKNNTTVIYKLILWISKYVLILKQVFEEF